MISAVPTVAAMASYPLADLDAPASTSLAQNESAFPPSPKAVAAGQAALGAGALYPDPDWRDLRSAISMIHRVRTENILCGAGSMELIGCAIRAFAGPGDDVVGTQYGYLFVATAVQQAAARYVPAEEPAFCVDVETVLEQVTERTRIVVLCNPGNPTGTSITNTQIVSLRAQLPPGVLLLVDQAYAEFDPQDHAGIFDLVNRGDTMVTRTFSKAYGLAGARVGWAACPGPVAKELRKLLNPNNVTLISQAMATAAMLDQAYMKSVVAQTAARRDRLAQRLSRFGYDVRSSATNFLLIRFDADAAAQAADAALRADGLILRSMGGYGLPDCLRVTIGTEAAMTRVGDVLEGLK